MFTSRNWNSDWKDDAALGIAALFPQNDAFTKVNLPGLWDWLMKKASRGFILKKRLEDIFLSICLRSQWFITPSAVLILFETINVTMIVEASYRLLLLFLSGFSQESMLWRTLSWFVCRFRYFLVNMLYFWKLGHVVVDFPCVVASWFRQNFDQIESIFVLIFL